MWRKAAYLKGRNHSEKSGYSALSSVLSSSNHGLFPPVPTTGPTVPQHSMPVLENLYGSQ